MPPAEVRSNWSAISAAQVVDVICAVLSDVDPPVRVHDLVDDLHRTSPRARGSTSIVGVRFLSSHPQLSQRLMSRDPCCVSKLIEERVIYFIDGVELDTKSEGGSSVIHFCPTVSEEKMKR